MGDGEVYSEKKCHFVLVHGAAHGAWSWYKVLPPLKAAGHRVTAVDLAASGINLKTLRELSSMEDYTEPLLEFIESLPDNEKVVLVGHSLGGLNLAVAAEKFPQKIAATVFVSAFMPDTVHNPAYVIEQYTEKIPSDNWVDTKLEPYETKNGHITSMVFGPKFVATKLYNLSPIEDRELAMTLLRPSSLFVDSLSKEAKFSEKGYGSVPRIFVICDKDMAIPKEHQQWMIENGGVTDVFEIPGADHMAMISKPKELCEVLDKIALKYA